MSDEKKVDGATTSEDKKEVVVPEKFKSIVETIEKMTVLDLSELVKILEDKFGVSATAPMMMGAMPSTATAGEQTVADEKSEFNIELTSAGENKIGVIKVIREISEMGLKEAKDLVDGAPAIVKENVKKEEAEEIKKKLETAGGSVILK
ncbi:MAG: 50S ribosomal protein L7/L12 [Patescibacteria group bacterium]